MNFYSDTYVKGIPFRVVADQPTEITATVAIPAGYALQTADRLYLFKVGADHSIDEIVVRTTALDLAQTPTLTLDVGYEAAVATDDLNAFIAAATTARAGGQIQVENGGDDPFAAGLVNPFAENLDILASAAASASSTAGSGSVGPATGGGFITVTAKLSRRQNVAEAGTRAYDYGADTLN